MLETRWRFQPAFDNISSFLCVSFEICLWIRSLLYLLYWNWKSVQSWFSQTSKHKAGFLTQYQYHFIFLLIFLRINNLKWALRLLFKFSLWIETNISEKSIHLSLLLTDEPIQIIETSVCFPNLILSNRTEEKGYQFTVGRTSVDEWSFFRSQCIYISL